MPKSLLAFLIFALCLACGGPEPAGDPAPQLTTAAADDADRWEEAMQTFEKADSANPPPKGGIVFFGSSSFRRWDLEKSFPGMGLINRGFGGSQMSDAIRYLDRAVLPLEPRTIFVYEGDNDIGGGKTPEIVEADYRTFVEKARAALPNVKIVFVAIKPSIRRWELIDVARDANARVKAITETDDLLEYIDVDAPLLDSNGQPRADLFIEDDLHLNEAGYEIWTELIRPYLN